MNCERSVPQPLVAVERRARGSNPQRTRRTSFPTRLLTDSDALHDLPPVFAAPGGEPAPEGASGSGGGRTLNALGATR